MADASVCETVPARTLLRGPDGRLLKRAEAAPCSADTRTADDLLREIAEEIDRQEVAAQPEMSIPPLLPLPASLPSLTAALSRRRAIFGAVAVDEPDTAAEARTIHARRQLEAAAEHGAAMLAALGLPRLVYPDFVGVDPMAALDALDAAVVALDALDGDADLEDGADDEFTGDDELSLGWTAKVDQVHLGYDQDDHEVTALERHGLGFFRSGPDDAEDDDPAEHDFRSHGPAPILRPLVAHA